MNVKVDIKLLSTDAVLPTSPYSNDAGFDLTSTANILVAPGDTYAVPTGLAFAIPTGWQLEIRPRSGLSLKSALRIANSPGTIDSGFNSEVKVLMWNSGTEFEHIDNGDRIAQLVLTEVHRPIWNVVEELPVTDRGNNGFGSSDK